MNGSANHRTTRLRCKPWRRETSANADAGQFEPSLVKHLVSLDLAMRQRDSLHKQPQRIEKSKSACGATGSSLAAQHLRIVLIALKLLEIFRIETVMRYLRFVWHSR